VGINQGKIATKLKDMRRRTLIITSFSTVTNLIEQLGRLNRADSVAPAKAILLFGESAQDLAETKGIIEALHASEVTSGGPVVRQLLKALPDKLHRMEEQLRRLHERNAILADLAS
jgi:uroporphyrinogen-III synthase